MRQSAFAAGGSAPNHAGGAYSAPPDPLAQTSWIWGGEGKRGREVGGEGNGRGKEREGWEGGNGKGRKGMRGDGRRDGRVYGKGVEGGREGRGSCNPPLQAKILATALGPPSWI